VTKFRGSDRDQWRDQFERTGQNPVAWQVVARAHLLSANVLIERLRAEGQGKDDWNLQLRLMPVFLLLGYALENLVKGLLVARGETATWAGSFDEGRSASLDKNLKHHCLPEFFRIASVKTSARERRLLEDLRDAIESEKYPVGVRPRSRSRTLGLDPWSDIGSAFELFARMEQSLRQICLDMVLFPCKPSSFGTDDQAFASFVKPG
jgi:hypothetical protein